MHRGHLGWSVALGAAILLAGACQSDSSSASRSRLDATSLTFGPLRDDVAPPPGLDARLVTPLQGEALHRARLSLMQILAVVPAPDYLQAPPATQPADSAAEPPLAAQRAYVAGRQAMRAGDSYQDAIRHLEQARRLAPHQPEILRLLGRIYTGIGNKVRGATYFEQAVAIDPQDAESLFALGRFALEQGEPGEAIFVFHRVLQLIGQDPTTDPALRPLVHYQLAGALSNAGYAAAAVAQHRAYLAHADGQRVVTRSGRELAFLNRQQGMIWQSIGDLHHQLGEPPAALLAYEAAQAEGVSDAAGFVRRLIYTHLRLSAPDAAQRLVIDRLGEAGESDTQSLALVHYLIEAGVPPTAFADRLERVYRDADRPAALALAIADLLPPARGRALLLEHLKARPADREVYERLLTHWLLPDGAGDASTAQVVEAIRIAAEVIAAAPNTGDAYLAAFLRAADDMPALLRAVDAAPASLKRQPTVQVIQGLAMAASGQVDEAEAVLERAMQADAALTSARMQLAKIAVVRGQHERAARLLEPLAGSTDPDVVALRVHVLAATGAMDEALALLDRVIDTGSAATQLILQKAQLQLQANQPAAAERTLLDALNARPTEETLYLALLNLYDPPGEGASPIEDAQRQWQRIVWRLLGTIPNSRVGRLVHAQILAAEGRFTDSEDLLKQLLAEDAQDLEALLQLLEVYVRSNRRDEALALMDQTLAAAPEDPRLLRVAQRFYQDVGDTQRWVAVTERMLMLQPASPQRARALAGLYLSTDRPEQAVAAVDAALEADEIADPVTLMSLLWRALLALDRADEAERRLTAAIERFPGHAADLGYERAILAERAGDKARSEALMLEVLARFPDHAQTNNGLGYTWADQGKNLEQAKAMVQRAVDADPDQPAYLDSLGWVYYKLGQFDEALVWLRRARAVGGGDHPVILDHLGDALYRNGQSAEAQSVWQEAQALLRQHAGSEDPDLVGLGDRLNKKLAAVKAEGEPAVAAVAGQIVPPAAELQPAEAP